LSVSKLREKCRDIAKILLESIERDANILLVTHHDADGLSAGGLMGRAIYREGGRFTARTFTDLTEEKINQLVSEKFDLNVFLDLGTVFIKNLRKVFNEDWIVIDHHQLVEDKDHHLLNPYLFEISGDFEISGSGLAYLVAKEMNLRNRALSYLGIVGAVGDRQDVGKGRKLVSLNREVVLKDAEDLGLIETSEDLIFYGRESRPIHEAIASTLTPYIPVISGNSDMALALLTSLNLKLKEGERWRVISELSLEEKKKIVEGLIPYIVGAGESSEEALSELFGEVYTLVGEGKGTPLRDAREFASLLNACGRMRAPWVGLLIAMGDREEAYREGRRIYTEYRRSLTNVMQELKMRARPLEAGVAVEFIGDGLVWGSMTGAISSLLSSLKEYEEKIVLVRTVDEDGKYKISIRRGRRCRKVNVGQLAFKAATEVGGVGGGHEGSAGAKVDREVLMKFVKLFAEGASAPEA